VDGYYDPWSVCAPRHRAGTGAPAARSPDDGGELPEGVVAPIYFLIDSACVTYIAVITLSENMLTLHHRENTNEASSDPAAAAMLFSCIARDEFDDLLLKWKNRAASAPALAAMTPTCWRRATPPTPLRNSIGPGWI
jgi:hypothetical protein